MTWLYRLGVIDGPLPLIIWALTVLALIVLLIRRPTPAWLWRIVIASAAGIGAGVALVTWANATLAFGTVLPQACGFWVPGGFAAVLLGAVSLWERGWWRKVIAVLLIILSLVSTTLGVNAAFGVNTTVGAMLGVSAEAPLQDLPKPASTEASTGPLYQTWTPPPGMPTKGTRGTVDIPSGSSFSPRPATVYLPPAALVDGAPRLPLIVMMMGHPGNPDATFVADALDAMAAKNKGLAPIVIVADQLGPGGERDDGPDPICMDSAKYGDVEKYFTTQIPAYATTKLNVLPDHKDWTIMGYSNGGACAFAWAARHPDVWGNLVSISPDEYPGVEWRDAAIRTMFGGDASKLEANNPAAGLAAHPGAYAGHLAVFTVGENDPGYVPGAKRNADLAQGAGFQTTYYVVPGADHVATALRGGIPFAMDLLYRHLGLSAP